MNEEIVRYPRYRWVILAMAWVTMSLPPWGLFLIPVLAYRLIPDLGLTQAQYTLIFTAPGLVAIFVPMIGGGLGDRFGVRLVVGIGILLAGVIGLARGFASSFGGLLALMLLYGIPMGLMTPNMPKLVSSWFPPREHGLAAGIYMSATATGMSFGQLTGPQFTSWRLAFITVGIAAVFVAALWGLLARNAPKGVTMHTPPLLSGLKRGMRSRNIRLVAISQFLFLGSFMSFAANFPKALDGVRHVDPAAAGAIASLFTWGLVAGNVVLPPFSDRVGLRKPFIITGLAVPAVCLFFAWQMAPTAAALILTFVGGFILGGVMPLVMTLPIELPEIGHDHIGGAAGIVGASGSLGNFLLPLVMMSPLVASGTLTAYTSGFFVAMLILAAAAVPYIFVLETGLRARARLHKP